jgi:hypothetical protein
MPPAIRIRVKGSISHVKQARISHSSHHKNVKKGTARIIKETMYSIYVS